MFQTELFEVEDCGNSLEFRIWEYESIGLAFSQTMTREDVENLAKELQQWLDRTAQTEG